MSVEKQKTPTDWFVPAMFAAVIAAAAAPRLGAAGGVLHADLVTQGGVAAAFFIYGLTLSFGALRGGALHWRLHLAVQAGTFLVFPLAGVVLIRCAAPWLSADLRFGFLYLCALPSTISSSVALTAVARGNVAGAVFNATLSSLLGVVLTPLWLHTLTGVAGAGDSLGGAMLDIAQMLVLPMIAGQACRPWLAGWAARHRRRLALVDRLLILFLIYASFCDSFARGVWAGNGLRMILGVTGGAIALFVVATLAMLALGRALGFNHADRMALFFCGSKKSLAQGVTMAKVLLAAHPAPGLVLLPLMIYHALQLVVGGLLAPRWAEAAAKEQSQSSLDSFGR